jgi:tellurite methyltransferase
MAYRILEKKPPTSLLHLLDIGCGEGKDSIFFARNGYHVSAFDAAETGIKKAQDISSKLGLQIDFQVADINEYRPLQEFDVIFSSGVLQYLKPNLRKPFVDSLKKETKVGGVHVLHTFVNKPFLARAPDAEDSEALWSSGELMSYYHDWQIEWSTEEIKDCMSSGVPHKHAHNRILAIKPKE